MHQKKNRLLRKMPKEDTIPGSTRHNLQNIVYISVNLKYYFRASYFWRLQQFQSSFTRLNFDCIKFQIKSKALSKLELVHTILEYKESKTYLYTNVLNLWHIKLYSTIR